ncbi:MAG: response regulator [Desulfobacterales bacterium]|nr:response regulator [Desulfobacterales bacterium]
MKILKSPTKHWRKMNITAKFASGFGLLLTMIVMVSITGYVSLTFVRNATEAVILTSTEIRRMVLEMDGRMEKARRLNRDFFLQYPEIGFENAHKLYALPSVQQIEKVAALSAELKQMISKSEVSNALQKRKVDLNLYLSSAKRFSYTFSVIILLVTELTEPETGLQAKMSEDSTLLQDLSGLADDHILRDLYRDMQSFEKDYLLTRQRPFMQSAFNTAFLLHKAINNTSGLKPDQKAQARASLDNYVATAEKILKVDVAIRYVFDDFAIQAQAVDPISAELIALSKAEVENGLTEIDRTSRFATTILIVISTAGLLLAVIIAIILNNSITRNLVKLAESAGELQAGNLNVHAMIKSDDELGRLAESFNNMAARITDLVGNLEQKVVERTHELEEKNEELQKTLRELEESRRKADAANRAKSEFLANMSHELRTPLNAVTGFSELLSSLVSDRKQKSYLDSIKTAGKSLLTLINDILDLSKIEAGMMEIMLVPVNPLIIFSEIEQIFKMKIASKNLQFVTEIDKKLPCAVILDETRLRQILLNLVGNAVKFTEKGHIKLTAKNIYKTDDRTKTDLIITVEDTGIGISEHDLENIFKSFRQQDGQSTRKYGGTGLGLSISRKLVELMNGQITVDSRAGAGSTFKITLRDADVLSSEIPVTEEKIYDIENITFEKAKILVADDVESNRSVLKEILSKVNLDILTAENGQEAVLMAGEYRPDIILMDIRMPVMDGIEATKRLKNNPKTKDIPIIAVTASSTAHDKSEILAEGLDGYLTKPVKLNALFGELSRYLNCTEKSGQVAEPVNRPKYSAYDDIERLPELVSTLRNEILPSLHNLHSAMIMGNIKEFGNRLQQIGKEYKARGLVACGEDLNEFAKNFDITNIDNILKEFPELVEQLADTFKGVPK